MDSPKVFLLGIVASAKVLLVKKIPPFYGVVKQC